MPLSANQRSKVRRLSKPAEADEEGSREVNVVPFLDIIMNVLMFVLATIAVTFTATIDVRGSAGRSVRPPTEPSLDLSILVVTDGFSVKARGGNVAPGCAGVGPGIAIPRRNGTYDFAALRECAEKLKATLPAEMREQAVTVTANPDVPYQVLISTTDALRVAKDGAELFPEVAFGVIR